MIEIFSKIVMTDFIFYDFDIISINNCHIKSKKTMENYLVLKIFEIIVNLRALEIEKCDLYLTITLYNCI